MFLWVGRRRQSHAELEWPGVEARLEWLEILFSLAAWWVWALALPPKAGLLAQVLPLSLYLYLYLYRDAVRDQV